jgi:hypothetical protein
MVRYLVFPDSLEISACVGWFYPTTMLVLVEKAKVANLEAAMQFSKLAMIGLGYQ